MIAALQSLHWLGWVGLFVGVASLLHEITQATRYVRRGDVIAPVFVLPIAALTIVLYMAVTP